MKKLASIFLTTCIMLTSAATTAFAVDTSVKPVIHYNFEQNFDDASGNGYHGTKNGNVNIVDGGVNGKCAEFKGGYIEVSKSENLNFPKEFTLATWIKLDTQDNDRTNPIFEKLWNDKSYGIVTVQWLGMSYGSTRVGSLIAYKEDPPNMTWETSSSNWVEKTQTTEKWTHIAIVYKDQEVRYYVDGALTDSQTAPADYVGASKLLASGNLKIRIGKDQDQAFKGKIDELRMFDKAATDKDIENLYNEFAVGFRNTIVLKMDNPKMLVNNVEKEIDPGYGTAPYLYEGRTFVPIRAIIESMGGTVAWTPEEQRVDIKVGDKIVKVWVSKLNASVNNKTVNLEVAPHINNGRTMLPLRFVTENLGCKVEWDGATQSIIIRY